MMTSLPKRRVIDLCRCLVHDSLVECHRCEEICPKQAIKHHQINSELCDDCGLCTAVCPVGAIEAEIDYDTELTQVTQLEPQVLMCKKAGGKLPCLGVLNRRMLWTLASKRQLAIDTSRCAECKPAVNAWLEQEINACNEVLRATGKQEIALVHVRTPEATTTAPKVARRNFFSSLFHSTAKGVADFTAEQTHQLYMFDPVIWQEHMQTPKSSIFPGLLANDKCTGCGLCQALCQEKAIAVSRGLMTQLVFSPTRCTACGVCLAHCPPQALTLQNHFTGKTNLLNP